MRSVTTIIAAGLRWSVIGGIRLWQISIGPFLRLVLAAVFGTVSECKFRPSCSQFTIEQIRQHGTITGLKRGLHRIRRCH